VPWPTDTGLRSVGNPGPESPVLVTGNYDLTVRRLLRALEGEDVWVVVAPSGGINVWCASSGGLMTTHQVVTALKTSGIDVRVRHRRAILPQLAATGVVGREVTRRCGWRVRFGPVRAEDLPDYLAAREKKSDDMRRVRYGLRERLEMSTMLGGPAAIVLGLAAAIASPTWVLPTLALIAAFSAALFLLYDRIPGPRQALAIGSGAAFFALVVALFGGALGTVAAAGAAGALVAVVLTYDYAGATPIEGGSHFEERRWKITLDRERCKGVYSCVEVCPEACFDRGKEVRKADLARDERCIRCGACVVQCPQDALYFTDSTGARIEPATIRRYKLNLLGQRGVDTGERSIELDA
jgi:NAD-dependent dihydropyrimidine dehydrogenase PreA subunit